VVRKTRILIHGTIAGLRKFDCAVDGFLIAACRSRGPGKFGPLRSEELPKYDYSSPRQALSSEHGTNGRDIHAKEVSSQGVPGFESPLCSVAI